MYEYIIKIHNGKSVSCGQLENFQSRYDEVKIHQQEDNYILVGRIGQLKTKELNYDKEMLYYNKRMLTDDEEIYNDVVVI